MNHIKKEKVISRRQRVIAHCLIVGLVCSLIAITPCTATEASSFHTTSGGQDYLSVVKLLMEGQVLMKDQSKEGLLRAIDKFKEATEVSRKINFNEGRVGALLWQGIAYDFLGKKREALNLFVDALRYCEESWISFMCPILKAITGATYASLGENEKALEMLNEALPKLIYIPQFHAYALKGLGEVYWQIGRKNEAVKYLTESLKLYREVKDWRHEVEVSLLISVTKSYFGQPTEALDFAKVAIKVSKEHNDPSGEAYARLAYASAYSAIGNLELAATEYEQMSQLLQKQGDYSGEATALNNLGLICYTRGEFDRALNYYNRALSFYECADEPGFMAYALNNMAIIFARRGDPIKAFKYFQKALKLAAKNKDERLRASVISSIADFYYLDNSPNYAIKLFEEAAKVFAGIEEPNREFEARLNLAQGYTVGGHYQEALDILHHLLESQQASSDSRLQGYCFKAMAVVYVSMREYEKALTYYQKAISKLDEVQDNLGKVELYHDSGWILASNKDYQKAKEQYNKALALAQANDLTRSKTIILAGLGFVHEKQGNMAKAEDFYDQEIKAAESLLSSARIEELKNEAGSVYAIALSPAILFKFKLGKWSEAFNLTEKSRARAFLDQMNNARIDIRGGADPELAEQEQSLRFEIRSTEDKLRKEQRKNPLSEASALMTASLKEKEEAYNALQLHLKASNSKYIDLINYDPMPLDQIQRLLGPQTTLISYFITADKTLAFVVRSDSIQAVEIPVGEAELRKQINWFRSFPSLFDTKPQSLKQLHDWLIAPIRQYIKTEDVVIVPHGILHYLPFAALNDGSRYFGDDHKIYHLPSAATLPILRNRNRKNGNRLLALSQSQATGLSSLGYADKEATKVAELYQAKPFTTGYATKEEFLKTANVYDIIHIAAHAELKATSPLFSRILLAPNGSDGGAIEVREIYEMELTRTNLVVLSACETQLGAHSKGDDIIGLNRAFIYAGASSVIASLWVVDDEATSLLMQTFYNYLKRGLSKAAALQAAQTVVREKYPHPYYWSAFVLTGDPGENKKKLYK